MKTTHKLDIKRFEAVTTWCDEVEADVNASVMDVDGPVDSRLLI